MTARLAFGENALEIRNFHHFPEEAARGNPYNCTFRLAVSSGGFGGIAPCEYDRENFLRLIADLQKMYDFALNHTVLEDQLYGSRVEFSMDAAGHLEVSGKIFGEYMEHSLEFTFPADQTVLKCFVQALSALC